MRFAVAVLFVPLVVWASAPPAQKVPPKEIRKTLPLGAGKGLFLESQVGNVTIRSGPGAQADVAATVEADGDCSDNKDRVAKTEVLVDPIPQGVRVRTVQAPSKNDVGMLGAFIKTCAPPRVHYTITVPKTTNLDLRLDRSSVDVLDVDGDLKLRLSQGRVVAKGVAGAADVDLRGGEVRLGLRKLVRPSRVQMWAGSLEVSLPKNSKFDLNYEGHPRRFSSDFASQPREIAHVNGGGPRLDLTMQHGMCRLIASEPAPESKPAAKPANKAAR